MKGCVVVTDKSTALLIPSLIIMFGLRLLARHFRCALFRRSGAAIPPPTTPTAISASALSSQGANLPSGPPPSTLRGLGSLLRRVTRGAFPTGVGIGALILAPGPASAASFGSLASGGGFIAAFKSMGLPAYLLLSLGINWVGWGIAAALKTEKFYDMVGSLTFTTLTATSLALSGSLTPRKGLLLQKLLVGNMVGAGALSLMRAAPGQAGIDLDIYSGTQLLVSAMVGVWTLRLGSYLVARIHKQGKDSRFDEVKHQPGTFFVYWSMQALWVWITLSPVLIINTMPAAAHLAWFDFLGVALWGGGFALEAVADRQKDVWRGRPENKGKFIDEGLWSVSRHPNYLGEIVLWWGVFATCAGSFSTVSQAASVASPVFVTFILNYLSGIPILERQADQRWGHLPEYQQYKARTPVLVPWNLFSKPKQNQGYQQISVEGSQPNGRQAGQGDRGGDSQ